MILALLILSIALARYQYLAEDSVVNVLTLPKSEALQYISSSYEPSYIVTKQRHKFVLIISLIVRYNCTDVYYYHDKSKEENQFIVVAKDLLRKRTFESSGFFGKLEIQPMSSLTLISNKEDVFELL